MAQSESHGVPDSLRGASKIVSEINHNLPNEVQVLVVYDDTNIRTFVSYMYDEIVMVVRTRGGEVQFSEEDLLKYYITALKARVVRSTLKRIRSEISRLGVDILSQWQLPEAMAWVVNAIGQVEVGPGGTVRYYPVWNREADVLVLDSVEHARITRALRAVTSHGIRTVTALESKLSGVAEVMVLTYAEEAGQGHWASSDVFRVTDALAHTLAGIRRTVDYGLLPDATFVPPMKLDEFTVIRYLPEAAAMSAIAPR